MTISEVTPLASISILLLFDYLLHLWYFILEYDHMFFEFLLVIFALGVLFFGFVWKKGFGWFEGIFVLGVYHSGELWGGLVGFGAVVKEFGLEESDF